MIDKLKIEYIPIDQLKEYERNAKEHPESHIKQIAASIKEFGFNDPIGIDSDNTIIEGHGRLFAARKLKLKEVPIIRLEHLTESQKKAYIIAHNKLTMNTSFNLEILFSELESLDGAEQELTGFTDEEISDIFNQLSEDIKEKNIVEPEDSDPVSELGDIWLLDKHKVLCGSSTEEESYEKLLNGELIDLVVTDPPYNINFGESSKELKVLYQQGKQIINHRDIKNDNIENFQEFINSFFSNTERNMRSGAPIYVFSSDSENSFITEFDKYLFRHQILIWNKNNSILSRLDYHPQKESIIYGWKEGATHKWYGGYATSDIINAIIPPVKDMKTMKKSELLKILTELQESEPIKTDIFFHPMQVKNSEHPTMKPVNLLKRLMRNSSLKGDLVFDGFLGSGSTLIAAEQLSRKCYGIELNEHYVDVIVKRYIQYKTDNNEPYEIKLIRNGEEYDWEETGIEEILDLI